MAGAPPLVRIVAAELGEGLAGILVGIAADVVIVSTVDDLRLSGTAGRVQIAGVVGLALLWAVNLLVYRQRRCVRSAPLWWSRTRRCWSRMRSGLASCGEAASAWQPSFSWPRWGVRTSLVGRSSAWVFS
jgi:hypothetical protein